MSSTTLAVASIPTLSTGTPERSRCWECLRRRLVCDAVRPVCNKCKTSGIVCPGYDDKKPLTWLAPGKVTCRTRRKVRAPDNGSGKINNKPKSKEKRDTGIKKGRGFFNEVECIFHSDLRTDVCDVYEAVQYYNAVFYPYTKMGHASVPNIFVDQIPLKIVKYLPTAIAHNLVSIVFQHRMCVQTQWKQDCPSAKHAEARLHHHRGISIRALNEDIANVKTQSSDTVLTGVMLLLQSEIQSCISPNWRHHVTGILAMLACRGGAAQWVKSAPYLAGVLLSFIITTISANTTSPPFNQIEICTHDELLGIITELYPLGLHPYMPCPAFLFREIVLVNHLRAQASTGLVGKAAARYTAEGIIKRIVDFDSTSCTPYYEKEEHNDLINHMFQSAVVVFCIASLQSVGVLPSTHSLNLLRTVHSTRLFFFLAETRKDSALKKSTEWPVIVAGMAAGAQVDKRQFVEELLMDQSKDIGTPLPMYAKKILRQFWDSGATDWDSCFNQPYALVA